MHPSHLTKAKEEVKANINHIDNYTTVKWLPQGGLFLKNIKVLEKSNKLMGKFLTAHSEKKFNERGIHYLENLEKLSRSRSLNSMNEKKI